MEVYIFIPLSILVIVWGLYGLWLFDSWLAAHVIKRLQKSQPPSVKLSNAIKMLRKYGLARTLYKARHLIREGK